MRPPVRTVESMNHSTPPRRQEALSGGGLVIGMTIGAALGIATDSLASGIAIGMIIGIALGLTDGRAGCRRR